MADGEEAMSQDDWKEKCLVLEALLMKFRMQIIKIRELTADKVSSTDLYLVHLVSKLYSTGTFEKLLYLCYNVYLYTNLILLPHQIS